MAVQFPPTVSALGVVTATSLALGGATIGTNALAVTGTAAISASLAIGGATIGSDALGVAGTVTVTGSSLAPVNIASTDAGAALGPILDLYRNSASPAASDILAGINLTGMSSTGVKRIYGSIQQTIVTTTNGSEDGSLKIYTTKAGTLTLGLTLDQNQKATVVGPLSAAAIAVPAGGTAGQGLMVSTTANLGVFFGSGAPTLVAAQGSAYIRTDGSSIASRFYINTDGSTTWTSVVTGA